MSYTTCTSDQGPKQKDIVYFNPKILDKERYLRFNPKILDRLQLKNVKEEVVLNPENEQFIVSHMILNVFRHCIIRHCIYPFPINLVHQTDSVRLLFQINRCKVNTIWFRFNLIRFRKYFSVCKRVPRHCLVWSRLCWKSFPIRCCAFPKI